MSGKTDYNPYKGTTAQSGNGPYNNPNEIFHPGHRSYSSNLHNGIPQGISGTVLNIDFLHENGGRDVIKEPNTLSSENGAVQLKQNVLTEDKVVKPGFNAYSASLKTNKFKITLEGDNDTKGTFINL